MNSFGAAGDALLKSYKESGVESTIEKLAQLKTPELLKTAEERQLENYKLVAIGFAFFGLLFGVAIFTALSKN